MFLTSSVIIDFRYSLLQTERIKTGGYIIQAFRPYNFMILPVMDCQAECSYCFAKKNGRRMSSKTAEQAVAFIEAIAPEDRTIHLSFHGGEPLLAGEDFYAWFLPKLLDNFGRRISFAIQTNLWAMSEAFAELFRRYDVAVSTSVDGEKEMCDSQRCEAYYERTTNGLKILERYLLGAGRVCTIGRPNADRAAAVFRQSREPYQLHGAVPCMGRPRDNMSVGTDEMKRILNDSYEAYRADPGHSRILTIDDMIKGQFEGRGQSCTFSDCMGAFAAIGPEGDVYTCQRFYGMEEYRLGNIGDGLSEKDIVESVAFRRLSDTEEKKQTACRSCAHSAYCRGGCLYNALAAGAERDPYCEAYKALFDRSGKDMALEMGAVLLGRKEETAVLAMAGQRQHPYKIRMTRELIKKAAALGKRSDPAITEALRDPWPENRLNKLYLHLTFSCPLHCTHCYAEGGEQNCDELPPERVAGIVREAADCRFRTLVVTGGEPLYYHAFDRLCGMFSGIGRKGMRLVLRSSFGFPIEEQRMKMICEIFDEIVVSVDGDRNSHDARRGAGCYDQTVKNLEKAVSCGAAQKLALAAVLSRVQGRGPEGDSVRALAAKLHITKTDFRPLLPLGRSRGISTDAGQFCPEEAVFPDEIKLRHSCGLGQNLYIRPDGVAYPCYAWCGPDKILGRLKSESLAELLSRGGLYEYRRHDVDSNEKCRLCEVRYLCGGICKALVSDRENIDSGDFDCSARKEFFRELVKRAEEG